MYTGERENREGEKDDIRGGKRGKVGVTGITSNLVMKLVELCVTYLVSTRMHARRLNRPVQRSHVYVCTCVCLYMCTCMSSARDIHACNRYFHASIPVKGQPVMRASSRIRLLRRYLISV